MSAHTLESRAPTTSRLRVQTNSPRRGARSRVDGLNLHHADTKEKALEIARSRSDLSMLCSDLNLTHRTGVEVATEVRAIHPDLPVLFMSGNAKQMLDNTNLQGSIGFLQKPFLPNEFLARIQDIFSMEA